ncbi:MAG: hypothetical protein ACWA5R_09840 [bacterium]
MERKTFEVVFRGKLSKGADLIQVKQRLAKLFKSSPQGIEKIFSGGRVVIKRGLTHEMAHKYRKAIKLAGAITVVIDSSLKDSAPPPPSSSIPQSQPVTDPQSEKSQDSSNQDNLLAEPGAIITKKQSIATPDIDTSGLSLAEPGAILDQPEKTTHLDLDIDQFEMDAVGTVIIEPKKIIPPIINTQDLSLAEADSEFQQPDKTHSPDIDISSIDFAEDTGPIDPKKPVNKLEIDTSSLKIDPT